MKPPNFMLIAVFSITVACKPASFRSESPYIRGEGNGKSPAATPQTDVAPASPQAAAQGAAQAPAPAAQTNPAHPNPAIPPIPVAMNNSGGGGNSSNPWPWIIGGVAAAGVIGALIAGGGDRCDDAAITRPQAGDPPNPQHLSPFALANSAYNGGVCWGGFDRFCSKYRSTGSPEDVVVEAAIKSGKVDRRQANCAYRANVDWQISAQCR